jgi:putative oxidoreductase
MPSDASLLERLLATDRDRSLLFQRILLGVVIFPHGAQKVLGWFGGYGFSGTMKFFTDTMHLPSPIAFLVIIAESIGAIGLVLGAGTRIAAFGIAAVMLGAIFTTHVNVGFFMNWFGAQNGEGFEFHLLALALALPLMIRGGGLLSVDAGLLGDRYSQAA